VLEYMWGSEEASVSGWDIYKKVIVLTQVRERINTSDTSLTLSLLMPYIFVAPCKARNFNVWQCWKPSLSICCTMFLHWINAESYLVAQLCVNTLLATKVTLITDGI
jgi:hypothetical protein